MASAAILCVSCGKPSPSDRKFCSGCGKSLWESCAKCQTPRPASDRFCGSCGTDAQAAEQNLVQQVGELIDQAKESQARGEFANAQRLLWLALKVTGPSVQAQLAEARQLQSEYQQAEEHQRLARDAAVNAAQVHLQALRFADAEAALAPIPESLRNDEFRELLATARARREEVAQLTAEIKTRLDAQRYTEVLPRAERLLALQPHNESIKKILGQLGRKILEQAIARLQKQQFAAALDTLHQVPESSRDETYTKAYEQASEMTWLAAAVKTLPFADALLKGVIERLAKALPADEAIKKLQERFEQVVAAASAKTEKRKEKRFAPPSWAKPPEKSAFAAPIEASFGFRRLELDESPGLAAVRERPAQFYCAAGLALQGLGLAAVNANLLPAAEAGLFSGFSHLLQEKPESFSAWGLDCSSAGLKVVELRGKPGSAELTVGECHYFRPEVETLQGVSDDDLRRRREQLVKAFVAKCQPKPTDRICVGLSGNKVLGRFIELPPIPNEKLQEIVRYEAAHQIPIALDQVHWNHHVLGDRSQEKVAAARTPVMFLAAKNYQVTEHLTLFQDAGLRVDILQSDCVALHNWFVYDRLSETDDSGATLLLDIGSDATNFIVSSRHEVWFRSVAIGGHDYTSALVRHLQLTAEQAERLKRNPALGRRISPAFDAVGPLLEGLVKEIHRAIAAYSAFRRGGQIDRILGLGGGFQMPGLLRHLRLAE